MACQSYFIVLTICTQNAWNLYRLRPSVGLAQAHPSQDVITYNIKDVVIILHK